MLSFGRPQKISRAWQFSKDLYHHCSPQVEDTDFDRAEVAGRGLRDFLALQRRPSKGAGGSRCPADRHAGATAGGRGPLAVLQLC